MTPVPLRVTSGLMAALLAIGLLHLWRLLYPISDAAVLLVGIVALLIWRGTYRRAMALRRAWRGAVLRGDSWLFGLFQGRLRAHLAGLTTGVLGAVTLADFALAASPRQGLAAIAACLLAGVTLAAISRLAHRHTRADLVLTLAAPVALAVAGGLAAIGLFVIGWYLDPAPAPADAPDFRAALGLAQDGVPGRGGPIAEVLAVPRALETAGWWMVGQSQGLAFSPFGLMLLVLYNALVGFALVRFVIDTATAAHDFD